VVGLQGQTLRFCFVFALYRLVILAASGASAQLPSARFFITNFLNTSRRSFRRIQVVEIL
jgi:hypothetical protein